jgi:RHS repeat-associated protein
MRYDPQGRIVTGRGLVPGRGGNQVVRNAYSGLGSLVMLEHAITTSNPRLEEYKTDALGNRYWSRRHGSSLGSEDNPSVRHSSYDAYGRLLRVADPVDSEPFEAMARHDYDEAGRQKARAAHTTRYSGGTPTSSWIQEMHYYNSDGRLVLLERHNDQVEASPGEDNDLIERYRYDAFGRRVLVHTLRGRLACRTAGCESTVRRLAWDGHDLLYETRGPAGDSTTEHPVSSSVVENDRPSGNGHWGAPKAYGTVGYTHAGGIDRPLGLVRMDGTAVLSAFAPHVNWRGLYEVGTDSAGAHVTRSIGWPGKEATAFLGEDQPELPYEWFGSLISEHTDASGLLYRRNRYYDPQTGRFTQPDPIGLAGGLNLYGFAHGDPVNFSDPFGLCPQESDEPCIGQQIRAHIEAKVRSAIETVGEWGNKLKAGLGWLAREAAIQGGIALVTGGSGNAINITGRGLAHVVERHAVRGALNAGKSIFNAAEDIVSLVRGAESVAPVAQSGGRNFQRVVQAGREIGTDVSTGQPTSTYTVITNARNELVTAFPGVPR